MPSEGCVCQKCWIKVSIFHEFYTQIECIHRSNEQIVVEYITDAIKSAEPDDEWAFPSEGIDAMPQAAEKRRGKPNVIGKYDEESLMNRESKKKNKNKENNQRTSSY